MEGWKCPDNICTPICGDNLIIGIEECDDGNKFENDECFNNCTKIPAIEQTKKQ